MTETLLLPCAGLSSRYQGVRPKWMLTTPDGRLAVQRAAASVDPARIGRQVIAIRAEHEEKYGASQVVRRAFGADMDIVVLERDTNGPAETVSLMIERAGVSGPILIKDADSFFDCSPMPHGSFVGTCDLAGLGRGKGFPQPALSQRLREGGGLAPSNIMINNTSKMVPNIKYLCVFVLV